MPIEKILLEPEQFDKRALALSGCLSVNEYGDVRVHSCHSEQTPRSRSSFIDGVVASDVPVPEGSNMPFFAIGVFTAYSNEVQGMGWLTSEVGLIEITELTLE